MKKILLILAAVSILVLILFMARRNQKTLEDGLPERIQCASQLEAMTRAGADAIAVLGTGSMAPYIPAAPAGADPLTCVVAYAVPDPAGTFDSIRAGKLVVYKADWQTEVTKKYTVMHGAALFNGGGWVMSGLHNARSESWARVTRKNFRAIVAKVYVWN